MRRSFNKKVIVFGSCNLDLFFEVPDLSFFVNTGVGAEDGLHFKSHKQAPGGKGANQAVAAAKAGAKVHYFGAVGKGAHGRFLLENFKKLGIDTKGVKAVDTPTGVAVIFNQPGGKHKAIVSHAANLVAKQNQIPDALLNKNSIVVLQAESDIKQNAALVARGKKRGATIVYNVAPAVALPAKTLSCLDYLIVNRPEAEVIAKNIGMDASDLRLFAQAMTRRFKLSCIVTLGEGGVLASLSGSDGCISIPALKVKAIDSIGAGDAFVGAFVTALSQNQSPEDAVCHGVVAGALACTKLGAQTSLPSAKEIKKHLPKLKPISRKKAG